MQIVGMSIMMKVAYVWCSAYIVGLSFPKFFRWGCEDWGLVSAPRHMTRMGLCYHNAEKFMKNFENILPCETI